MPNPGEEALERFQKWCTAEGVTFDREALEIRVFEAGAYTRPRFSST